MACEAGEGGPRPLPGGLTSAPDEALSSWISHHAAFYDPAPPCSGTVRRMLPRYAGSIGHSRRGRRTDSPIWVSRLTAATCPNGRILTIDCNVTTEEPGRRRGPLAAPARHRACR